MKISGVKAVLSAQDLKCTTGKANLCPQEFLEGKVLFTNCCTYISSETFFE